MTTSVKSNVAHCNEKTRSRRVKQQQNKDTKIEVRLEPDIKRRLEAACSRRHTDMSKALRICAIAYAEAVEAGVSTDGELEVRSKPAIVTTDARGLITDINAAFSEMCGYSFEELRGKKPGALLQGKDTEKEIVAQFREAIRKRAAFDGTLTNYDKSGRAYRVKIAMQPFMNSSGKLLGFRAEERKLN